VAFSTTSHSCKRGLGLSRSLNLLLAIIFTAAVTLHDLTWLAGDWQIVRGGECTEEHWTLPSDTSLVGMSQTAAANRTSEFEFPRIEARADGIFSVREPARRAASCSCRTPSRSAALLVGDRLSHQLEACRYRSVYATTR
jgi:hypothetical protein